VAEAIVDEDPTLEAHPLLADEVHLFVAEESEEFVPEGLNRPIERLSRPLSTCRTAFLPW